jgi:S-adenosylmethionine:tRNA ribosyltransferase-isomerase
LNPDPELRISAFDYELPEELIAQRPLERRDDSRLLVLDRATGMVQHSQVRDLGLFLRAGDVVVINNSRVIRARLPIRRSSGGTGEVLLLRRDEAGVWEALARPARRLIPGESLHLDTPDEYGKLATLQVVGKGSNGVIQVTLDPWLEEHLADLGSVPLPPYIREPLADAARYQTIFASAPGSAAAPTAGLHLSNELMQRLSERGVIWVEVTLHIGLDTFRPVTVERLADHKMHAEWCTVSDGAAASIQQARAEGRRIIALGTTAARTLETAGRLWEEGQSGGFSTETRLFITPGHRWTVVDGMMTNFHLPRSSLIVMVSAFAGRERVLAAYHEAIERRYRFFSFGDAMLIV